MNFIIKICIITAAMIAPLKAFDCKIFIPSQEGAEYVTTNYNQRDKPQTIITRKLIKVETSGDQTVFHIHQVVTNKKGKDPIENTYQFRCKNGAFYADMKVFLNQPQMKAYQDMEMTVDAEDLEMPQNGTAGQTLRDGKVTAKINMGMELTITVLITNRKVDGEESVTTPAGTFNCIKISENVKTEIAFAKVNNRTVTWYSENHGVVKQETYDLNKPDNRTGYSLLTEIKK